MMAVTTTTAESGTVLPGLLRVRAAEIPEQTFLIDAARGRCTYAEFQARVEEFAGLLQALGVVAGDRVAVLLPTSIDEQATWLACSWLGAAQVPINPAYRGAMLAHVLRDCAPRVVLTTPDRHDDVVSAGATHVHDLVIGAALDIAALDTSAMDAPGPWDLAAIIYTSGTTGPSKGVLAPWGQLHSGIAAFDDMAPGDVLYAPFAAFHLGGKLPLQLIAHWGGTYVFRDGFKTDRFWPDVLAHGCNRAWAFHAMANFVWRQPPSDSDLDNPLETVTGGPLLADYRGFETRFGVRMRTNYGMTEIGWPITTGDAVDDHRSCGRARPGYDLRIVDEHDRELPDGQPGELIVRADTPWTMNLGYLGLPDATATAWRNGWFHTGDAFRRDPDGQYYFVDRAKDAIRRRSENISSFEVESMVADHPDVLECAAIGVPSGDGEEEIKVCIVLRDGHTVEPAALADFLVATMPRFMVPRYLEIVPELPKTPTSKVRKVELKRDPFSASTWDRLAGQ
jgi:carnitine-CoA ligase